MVEPLVLPLPTMNSVPPPEQELRQTVLDEEHLRLLRIGFFIEAGMKVFMAVIGVLYAVMGVIMAIGIPNAPARPGQQPPPEFFRWFFAAFGIGLFGVGVTMVVLNFMVARRLGQRRSRVFCMIVAGMGCIFIPYGTILAIFTLIVLARPSIVRMFAKASPGGATLEEPLGHAPDPAPHAAAATAGMASPPATVSSTATAEQGDATGGIIPYKNPPALIAYYCGVFSLIPCVGFILGLAAVILGVSGLKKRKQNPLIRGQVHAWIGIVLGSLVIIAHLLIAVGLMSKAFR